MELFCGTMCKVLCGRMYVVLGPWIVDSLMQGYLAGGVKMKLLCPKLKKILG